MASRRAAQVLARRAPQSLFAPASAALRFTPSCPQSSLQSQLSATRRPIGRAAMVPSQQRWHSALTSGRKSKIYEFQDVLSLLSNPSSSTLLIDVREPAEFSANSIPTALNIPITSQPDALLLPAEEFEDRFGFQKPPLNKEVVFYCKAGVRSSAAAQLAKQAGYENVGEYRGSWLDWERNGGPGTKSGPEGGEGAKEMEGRLRRADIGETK